MFKARHAFGIVIGVAVTIVAANALNMILNWETAAIVCGLLLGLEAGFWSGIPRLTYHVHNEVIQGMLSPEFWSALFGVVKRVVYCTTFLAGIAVATYITYKAGVWLGHQPWLYSLIGDEKDLYLYGESADAKIVAWSLVGALWSAAFTLLVQIWLFDSISGGRWWKCGALHIPSGLAVGAVMWLVLPLFCAALVLVLATGAIILAAVILACLFKVAGKHEAITITTGVIIGGLTGLAYGHWTQLALWPTTLSIVVGSAAGLASAYIMHRVGRSAWLLGQNRSLPSGSPTS